MQTAETTIPSIFIIIGVNWTCRVELEESQREFPLELQIFEAASRAVSCLRNQDRHNLKIELLPDYKDTGKAELGTIVLCHLAGQDPNKAVALFSHILLGNIGAYKESYQMERQFQKQIESIKSKKSQIARQEKQTKYLENFDELKKEMLSKKSPKSKRKPRK